jgi:hypothetical protein
MRAAIRIASFCVKEVDGYKNKSKMYGTVLKLVLLRRPGPETPKVCH